MVIFINSHYISSNKLRWHRWQINVLDVVRCYSCYLIVFRLFLSSLVRKSWKNDTYLKVQECTRVICCDFLTHFFIKWGKHLNRFCFRKLFCLWVGKKTSREYALRFSIFSKLTLWKYYRNFHRVHYMLELFFKS